MSDTNRTPEEPDVELRTCSTRMKRNRSLMTNSPSEDDEYRDGRFNMPGVAKVRSEVSAGDADEYEQVVEDFVQASLANVVVDADESMAQLHRGSLTGATTDRTK